MFCPKCGTKALDGAGFCQKCGAKLIVDDSAAHPAVESPANSTNPSASAPKEAPAKKKSKKLPIIIGVAVLVVLAVIFIAMNWEGKTDYEATVRAHAPFANSQGLPYTYGKVFDKYIPNAKWEVRESDDAAHVDIIGKAKGTDAEMVITIKVSLDEKDTNLALISPTSVSVSGNESPTEDEAVGFLLAMFIAYDEGDEDLSNFSDRLDEIGLTTQGDVSLTETFTDADSGISFQYSSGWTILDSPSEFKIVEMLDSQNTADHVATLNVDLIFDQDPYGVFTQDEAAVRETVNEYHTFIDFGNTTLGGIPAKALRYQTQQMNRDDVVVNIWYKIGENVYQVRCTYTASDANRYEPVFEAIMNSYAITSLPPTGSPTNGTQINSIDEAQKLVEDWLVDHPIGPMAGAGTGASENDVSAEYFVLELWEAPREFCGLVYVRKSDGYMTFHDSITDEEYDLDAWYQEWYSVESAYATQNDAPCYNGVPLIDWFEYSPEEIYGILGQPDYGTPVTGELLYGGTEFFGYTDAIAFEVYSGSISSVRVVPGDVEINGTALDKTRTEIVELLGEAPYEDNYYDESGDFRDCYFMHYIYGGGGTILRIEFPDSNSVADSIQIFRYTDGI